MSHLHPGGREEENVGDAEQVLEGEECQDCEGEGAMRAAQAAGDESDDEGSGDKADGGMEPANLQEPGAAGGEILRDGVDEVVRGIERIAEGGE